LSLCHFVSCIIVTTNNSYAIEEVADSTIALMLMLTRKSYYSATQLQYHNYLPIVQDLQGAQRTSQLTVGIIGLGNIGTCVAQRLVHGFGVKQVQFYDPYVRRGIEKSVVSGGKALHRCETLQELMSTSNVVTVHCNLTSETREMINEQSLVTWMKESTTSPRYLINTARGGIVNEQALIKALDTGILQGAAIDVVEREPYSDFHLKNVKNLIVTSHCAFYSDQSFEELRHKAATELLRILNVNNDNNTKPWYAVNLQSTQFKQ